MPTAAYMREYRKKQKAKKKREAAKASKAAGKPPVKAKPKTKPKTQPKKPLVKAPAASKKVSTPARKGNPRGGQPGKDAAITDNFNKEKTIQPTKADIKRAKEILGIKGKMSELDGAYDMLADMRDVYSKAGGRKQLLKMVKGKKNEKQFMALAKDLMKVEVALLSARIRKEGADTGAGGNGQQNFFVVLKGLEQEQPLLRGLSTNDGTVDIVQIQDAINPDKVTRIEDKGGVDRSAPPEEILPVVDPFDGEEETWVTTPDDEEELNPFDEEE